LLSPRDEFIGSPGFFRTLEMKLPEVIAARTSQFFTCPATPVARAREVLEELPEDEVAVEAVEERAA
jgi:hypothetical protein